MARRYLAFLPAVAAAIIASALYALAPAPRHGTLQGFQTAPTAAQALKLRTDLAAAMHTAATSLPVPSGGSAGGSLASWSLGGGFFTDGVVLITASGTTTLTGPVGLYGGLVSTGKEYLLGKLNAGNDVALTSSAGYAERVSGVGAFDYLAIGGVSGTITPSGGQNVTVTASPIQY